MMTKVLFFLVILTILPLSCFGTDQALVVGIDEYRSTSKCNSAKTNLKEGCIPPSMGGLEDAKAISEFIVRRYGFDPRSITQLRGESATGQNIRAGIQNLVNQTQSGDRVFIYFSGHGTNMPDTNGDEEDGRDEALVAFDADVASPTTGFIMDDEVVDWIRRLKGRKVVMVFDSCFSGGLTRAVHGEASRFLEPIDSDRWTVTLRGLTSGSGNERRDRGLTKEKFADDKRSNAVIISAAAEYQEAFPMRVNGAYRGAFSYLFERIQDVSKIPLLSPNELVSRLKAEMERIGKPVEQRTEAAKSAGRFQLPSVEIYSDCSRGDVPLFADAAGVCGESLSSTGASFVSLQLRQWKPIFEFGEQYVFNLTINREGFVYIIVLSEGDIARCIFPFKNRPQTKFSVGTKRFPPEFAFKTCEPFGRDQWITILSQRPLLLKEGDEGTWTAILQKAGLNISSYTSLNQKQSDELAYSSFVLQTRGSKLQSCEPER